jgi:hypothetical protein
MSVYELEIGNLRFQFGTSNVEHGWRHAVNHVNRENR